MATVGVWKGWGSRDLGLCSTNANMLICNWLYSCCRGSSIFHLYWARCLISKVEEKEDYIVFLIINACMDFWFFLT